MSSAEQGGNLQKLDDGIILQQLDDLCFVRVGEGSVDAGRTRDLGEKLIAFIEKSGCRKLVMSFDGLDFIYGFLIDSAPPQPKGPHFRLEAKRPAAAVGSDVWLG
jgi:hypothetical protein